jgi:hypothetical protein
MPRTYFSMMNRTGTIPFFMPRHSGFAAIQNGILADSILLSLIMSINGLRNQRVSVQGITPADPAFHRVRELMQQI